MPSSALWRVGLCLACVMTLALAAPIYAQAPRDRRLEVGVGVGVTGPVRYDRVDANEGAFGGLAKTVYSTRSTFGPTVGPEVRIGLRLSKAFGIESTLGFAAGSLRAAVSGDAERLAGASASERVTDYRWSGGLVWRFARGRRIRFMPFAEGGAGVVRQVHEGRVLVQTGTVYYAGGGVELPLGDTSKTSGLRPGRGGARKGFRIDARATIPRDGIAFDDAVHVAPAIGAAFYARF